MKNTLIYFNKKKFETESKCHTRIAILLTGFLQEFNNAADSIYKINNMESLYEAFSTPSNYVKKILIEEAEKVGGEFKIGNKRISDDQILELNLVEIPTWLESIIKLSGSKWLEIKSFPVLFSIDNYIFNPDEVRVNPSVIETLKESNSYYLNPDKEKEFDALKKIIEEANRIYLPLDPKANRYDILHKYLNQHLMVDDDINLIPDPDKFKS